MLLRPTHWWCQAYPVGTYEGAYGLHRVLRAVVRSVATTAHRLLCCVEVFQRLVEPLSLVLWICRQSTGHPPVPIETTLEVPVLLGDSLPDPQGNRPGLRSGTGAAGLARGRASPPPPARLVDTLASTRCGCCDTRRGRRRDSRAHEGSPP